MCKSLIEEASAACALQDRGFVCWWIVSEITEEDCNYCRRDRLNEGTVSIILLPRSKTRSGYKIWIHHLLDILVYSSHVHDQTSCRCASKQLTDTKGTNKHTPSSARVNQASGSGGQTMCLSALDITKPNDWLDYCFCSWMSQGFQSSLSVPVLSMC
jgi:hypothetical protein